MRKLNKIPSITIQLSENFCKMFEQEQQRLSKKLGVKIPKNAASELMVKSGLRFEYPKNINIDIYNYETKNNKKKRRL